MTDLIKRARAWIAADPDPETASQLESIVESGDLEALAERMDTVLTFGTAGIRGEVGAGPGRMNRAVVIRTTYGLVKYLGSTSKPVIVGFDARPTSREFAEDTAGVLVGAGIAVIYFPEVTPTPIVAYAAKHLGAAAAVVVTASHNPPADNGYKVYGESASQIVSPVDTDIQKHIESAPPAGDVERVDRAFEQTTDLARPVPGDILDCYWEEVSSVRSRSSGSDLEIVYTPMHGVGRDVVFDVMRRAGHKDVSAVPAQAEPDGTFPTVRFPNPEEPGALDLALEMAREEGAELVLANDPDADRLAVVVPHQGSWRSLSGNEVGVLLADYMLANDGDPGSAIVGSSIVSSPMLGAIANLYGAFHTVTLTGFKWIVKAGLALEAEGLGRFIFGYEEALGYTVGSTVRDKDGISAALLFADLAADLKDAGSSVMNRLHDLWRAHGLWVSTQTSIVRTGSEGMDMLRDAVGRLADRPPSSVGGLEVSDVTDYRANADRRPLWLGRQALVELTLEDSGRILVRPSGTEPKLKVYVDLRASCGPNPDQHHQELSGRAKSLGEELASSLGV